jgi:hypothetical protein
MTEREPEQLREEIQATREELGETVEALADKADVKAHAKEKVEEIKSQAQSRAPLIAGAGILVALIVLWLIRRD